MQALLDLANGHKTTGHLLKSTIAAGAIAISQVLTGTTATAHESFADLVEELYPTVVNIITSSENQRPSIDYYIPDGSPLQKFFERFRAPERENAPPQRRWGAGSGFIISNDGHIVTNNHVIEGSKTIEVELYSGERLKASVVGVDKNTDIAVIKIESEDPLPFASFGDSDKARVGDYILAIGNPRGLGFSVSVGNISARERTLSGAYDDFIQTDAAINVGNSGGPMFNTEGEVIGVITLILTQTGGSEGIGFAMSSAVVEGVVGQLMEFGETKRGWLGVLLQELDDSIAEAFQLESSDGALIAEVLDGPAKEAGIRVGDVIVEFDGQQVFDTRGLIRMVGDSVVGSEVPVVVVREGTRVTVDVTLGRREEAEASQLQSSQDRSAPGNERLGMTLKPLDSQSRVELGLSADDTGLLVMSVDPDSEAYEKGIRGGNLIIQVGRQEVTTLTEFDEELSTLRSEGRQKVVVRVGSESGLRFVALSVD